MILNEKKDESLELFLQRCNKVKKINSQIIKSISNTTISNIKGSNAIKGLIALENKWYKSILNNQPDYSVYAEDEYLAELWACWIMYSKKYLKSICTPKSLHPAGIIENLGDIKKVVDLGCGCGYTTAGLKQIFPSADIYGTNIENTIQIKVARIMAKEYSFNIITDISKAGKNVDLIFASEYFEHIYNPIKELHKIFKNLNPRTMLIANSFKPRAIGHFNKYQYYGRTVDCSIMPRYFNTEMRAFGYEKVKTKLWNDRPSYWKKKL